METNKLPSQNLGFTTPQPLMIDAYAWDTHQHQSQQQKGR